MVKTKTGGDCVQNPSDPDATYDGHKGPGYQVQIAETCVPGNDVQLITAALPQTACEPDAEAVVPMLDQLEQGHAADPRKSWPTRSTPATRTSRRRRRGAWTWSVRSPAARRRPTPRALTVDDFAWDERTGTIDACPAGHRPTSCAHDAATATTRVEMPASACGECPFRQQCPIEKTRDGKFTLEFTDKERRLAGRRVEEQTEVFQERYAPRSGIESTNSGLKNRLGLGRLQRAWSGERVPCDPAQSRGLERAAGGGVAEAARLGEDPSGRDSQRERIWAD